jgi:hypothetical protein
VTITKDRLVIGYGNLDNNQLIANIVDWLAIPGEKEEEEAKPAEKG